MCQKWPKNDNFGDFLQNSKFSNGIFARNMTSKVTNIVFRSPKHFQNTFWKRNNDFSIIISDFNFLHILLLKHHIAQSLSKWWEFSLSFYAGNERWKFQKLSFAKKSRFSDREVIFWQTLLVLDQLGCVLLISGLRIPFWSILRRIFGQKIKNAVFPCQKWHFWPKISFIGVFLPKYAYLCQKNVSWG